jgi:GntR family transcriptional regulator
MDAESPTRLSWYDTRSNWYGRPVATSIVADVAYRELTDALRRGVFRPGTKLPGERGLAVQFGVSRSTLRAALGQLEAEGGLARSAQRGWFVPSEVVGEPASTLQTFTEMARARGLRPTSHVLERTIRPSTLEESAQLRIAPAARVLVIRRLRGMEDTPVCIDTNTLPLANVEPLATADLEDQSLYEWLGSACGISVHRCAYSVQAAAAEPELASLLDIEPGRPVLVGREVAYASNGTPVLIGINHYRGDAYRFQADLFRPHA